MDISTLDTAHREFLNAAQRVVAAGGSTLAPPEGEWNADQIVAHVALVVATTLATTASVVSGTNATFDNRIPLDTWTIGHTTTLAGGSSGLQQRVRVLGETLCALAGNVLSDTELDGVSVLVVLARVLDRLGVDIHAVNDVSHAGKDFRAVSDTACEVENQ